MLVRRSVRSRKKPTNMKIHSTPHACYVSLKNGLTLELTFETPPARRRGAWDADLEDEPAQHHVSGVWMFGEEVLFEVRVGQA
jgi:hypothetical protein